ncbi:hypothetical protein CVT24_001163, partial [Panaeolus cyanescens]
SHANTPEAKTPTGTSAFHHLRLNIAQAEFEHGHDFDSLLPILASSSLALRNASIQGVQCLSDWVIGCNSNRLGSYFGFGSGKVVDVVAKREEMKEVVYSLEERLNEFRTNERERVITPYQKFFDPVTKQMKKEGDQGFTSRYAHFIPVLKTKFVDYAFCESLLKILRIIIAIDELRPAPRIWFPGRSSFTASKLKDNITGQGGVHDGPRNSTMDNPVSMGTTRDPTRFDDEISGNARSGGDDLMFDDKPVKRDPDALPPSSLSGKLYVKFCSFFRFLKSPKGIFALRTGVLSVALWVPAVLSSSAWFYYEQKGMWGMIMAQMALAVYAGDQISGFVFRMFGTAVGLVIGVVLWYMGAGKGSGNPYALVTLTTVLLSPFIYLRLVASQQMSVLWIMIAVTSVFVVGYSWMNANMPTLGNPGVGIELGWRRALLVMAGFTASVSVVLDFYLTTKDADLIYIVFWGLGIL